MTLGPLMVDLAGPALTAEERELLRLPSVGGVILFGRNCESPGQVRALVEAIHRLRTPPLLVAVDQEGGRVQRLRDGFTRLPPMGRLGDLHARDPAAARAAARELGWLTAAELRAVGVDIDFAPVLDLDRGHNPVLGDRAFHGDPEVVADLAAAWAAGAREAGLPAVGKHFPGHGGVTEDSHAVLPRDPRAFVDIQFSDLVPFERMIHQGLAGIMAAHVVFPRVDPAPAGFSRRWLREVLRGRLGFEGAVFSDDLSMAAARTIEDPVDRARRSLEAGADMVLLCNAPEDARRVAEGLLDWVDPASALRLARFHAPRPGLGLEALQASPRWRAVRERIARLDEAPWLDLDL
ncbi:MAG: beta-N-acetylhexosaminidase [Gammaproteobacteria bacterium]|nr:MAG: beta-N-acetylhexosaminidase [Gammaproteobacteria bacterium]